MLPGIVMFDRDVQLKNAELPIVVTLSGIVTLDKDVQLANAEG